MTTNRAQKGGEYGINGYFYAGGQYLPSTMLKPMGKTGSVKGKKQEIAPYKWEVAPVEGYRSIYGIIKYITIRNGESLAICQKFNFASICKEEEIEEYRVQIQALVDLWNSGERWIEFF